MVEKVMRCRAEFQRDREERRPRGADQAGRILTDFNRRRPTPRARQARGAPGAIFGGAPPGHPRVGDALVRLEKLGRREYWLLQFSNLAVLPERTLGRIG